MATIENDVDRRPAGDAPATRTDGVVSDVVGSGEFAARLDELFRTVPGPDGRPFTGKAIAHRATELGFRLGESHLSQLRTGKAASPSFRTVEAIAAAFAVDIAYFLTPEAQERTREHIHLMRMQSDPRVIAVAFRHAGSDPRTAAMVDDLVRVLRTQQGLPPESAARPA